MFEKAKSCNIKSDPVEYKSCGIIVMWTRKESADAVPTVIP